MSIPGHISSQPPAAGPRKYMSKRQSACDLCRSRKSACQIETAPPCRLCNAHSTPCTFTGHKIKRTAPLSRRQPPPGCTDVSSTDTNPMLLQAQPQPSQQETTQLRAPQLQSQDWNEFFFPADPDDLSDNNSMHTAALTEEISYIQPIESLDHVMYDFDPGFFDEIFKESPQPQSQERSLDQLGDVTAQLCGLTGDMDPYLLRRYRFNENAEFGFSKLTIRTTQDTTLPVQFLLSANDLSSESRTETELEDEQNPSLGRERDQLSNLISVDIGKRLIQLFFRFLSPQFPILSLTHPPGPADAPTHLLAAIYCISQPFASYDDRLCIDFAYRSPSSQKLFNIAWKSLNRSMHTPTIATIQAALILLLQPPTNELVLDSAFKWALMGSIVSSAQTLGLHLDANEWLLPKEEVLLRKRLSWAVYAFDKWFAMSLGRPSHINIDNWLVVELTPVDLEYASASQQESLCLEFSRITQILEKVLTQLYTLRAVSSLTSDFKRTLTVSRELLKELTAWYQNMHNSFHMNPADNLTTDPDPRFSIHLSYHAVKILILRALLRPFYYAGATPPQEPQEQADWNSARANCRLGAKTGANDAIRSASLLRASHYQAFWAPWCKTHFALITNLLFLLAISSSPEETPEALVTLNNARKIYRVQARSFSMIRFALLRIDAVFWVGFDTVVSKTLDAS